MTGARWSARSFWGAPSGEAVPSSKDNLFWFGSRGLIFTSPQFLTGNTTRPAAVLLLSATGAPLEVSAYGRVVKGTAVVVPPMCTRRLHAGDAGLISINIHAHHPGFRAFSGLAHAGLLQLDRSAFQRY